MPEGLSAERGRQGDRRARQGRRPARSATSVRIALSRSPRPSCCRSLPCWRPGPGTRRRSGAPSRAWAWRRPQPRGRRRAAPISMPSTFGTSTPRPSRRGSPPTPPTTSRRWPWRSTASARISTSRSRHGGRRSPRRIPTRLEARPSCRSTDSRGSRGRRRSITRRRGLCHRRERGETADKYIRITVFLASVLFLVGISTRFPSRGGRYALVGLGAALLVFSVVQLTQLPGPPT